MVHPPPSSGRPIKARTRSNTVIAIGPSSVLSMQGGPPSIDLSSSALRSVTDPKVSAAAAALNHISRGDNLRGTKIQDLTDGSKADTGGAGESSSSTPLARDKRHGHLKSGHFPDPPLPDVTTVPSAPEMRPPVFNDEPVVTPDPTAGMYDNKIQLTLYTYKSGSIPGPSSQPSPLPSKHSFTNNITSEVHFNYASLPWRVRHGDYLEIRRTNEEVTKTKEGLKGSSKGAESEKARAGGEALKGVSRKHNRDGYIFRVGDDAPNVAIGQIQVPESVATAFKFQHRLDIELHLIPDEIKSTCDIDYIELRFSQYMGRADMWRLGMSLENSTIHVGEKVSLAGGVIKADVQGLWRGNKSLHRHSSGVFTSKTKTIYRSKSAQFYIFIQLCQETWEFDEDGERYYEKVVHGFLPELFGKWAKKSTSHLVTIILFSRIHYSDEEVEYMRQHGITVGLIKDYAGKWCKDFYKVAIDFERKTDWGQSLGEIKKYLERSEKEILLEYHLGQLKGKAHEGDQKRILGKWSFAYEGNVLEAVNIALNPFDEHYVDRDLSRTGLSMCVITPGTGHFAVDKNLLRLTTERMIDHGIALDMVCLTKMPLHSVPLFSYVSQKPKGLVMAEANDGVKTKPGTPDLLYFDAHLSTAQDCELADCYSIPKWVACSFYSKTHDKPFRPDRFIARCKMYDIQMLGILDHNLTTVTVPLLDAADLPASIKDQTLDDRKRARNEFDAKTFGFVQSEDEPEEKQDSIRGSSPGSPAGVGSLNVPKSYQSARLAAKIDEQKRKSKPTTPVPAPIPMPVHLEADPISKGLAYAQADSLPKPHSAYAYGQIGLGPPGARHEPLDLHRQSLRSPSPAPSSLTNTRGLALPVQPPAIQANVPSTLNFSTPKPNNNRSLASDPSTSPSKASVLSGRAETGSGASTPRAAPGSAKRLTTKSSKSSLARLASNWMFSLTTRSQPSFPTAATETVGRTHVSNPALHETSTPGGISHQLPESPSRARAQSITGKVPGAPIITPSTPSPDRRKPTEPLPVPTISHNTRGVTTDDDMAKSQKGSFTMKHSRSHDGSSLGRTMMLNNRSRHVSVNPCKPKPNGDTLTGDGRRWQHIRPTPAKDNKQLIKWSSLCAPACLPLTTDFMPTPQQLLNFYEANSYDIACFPDQISFLIRTDTVHQNLPLAVMREMASQRLAQNFQFIVLPHKTRLGENESERGRDRYNAGRKVLLPGESATQGLRVGGASEVLSDQNGAIYLSWSNHIHRLAFDVGKQSVTVQRFVKKSKHSTDPIKYTCLVWPAQMKDYQEASTVFRYPSIDTKLNFNYLDRLVAGEEAEFKSSLRFWRTRYILVPSGKDPLTVQGVVPKGENFDPSEVLMTGASKVLEIMNRHQWKPPTGETPKPLFLVATTFDPSACVLDEGLMTELERMTSGTEVTDAGKSLEGMTLQTVGEMMCQPNNGLIIRDRWWHFSVYEDSFTGELFCEWLINTFTDVHTRDEAAEWGRSLFDKGLIEHCAGTHGFFDYNHFFYRLRPTYDPNHQKRKKPKTWFGGGKPASSPRDLIEKHAAMSTSPSATVPLGRLGGDSLAAATAAAAAAAGSGSSANGVRRKKIKMSQSVIIDMDPGKKSDRAEVAMLHADIVHNARNAFHFELNWLGVTASLLDDLKSKCSAQAERYGLRFIEAPVEQIKDTGKKCPYRTAIPIPLALAPPFIPDLHLRLAEHGTGNASHFFEYAILTERYGFALDVESPYRYPDSLDVEYSYRGQAKFEYSQFVHKSGLALVQCIGGKSGFLWCDNRPFIAAPQRRGAGGSMGTGGEYPMAPVAPRMSKAEEATALRRELEDFCNDFDALKKFYEQVTPAAPKDKGKDKEVEKEKEKDTSKETSKEKEKELEKELEEKVSVQDGEQGEDKSKPKEGQEDETPGPVI